MVVKYGIHKTVQCIHCGADNPPSAYCCLSCFKVLRVQQKLPFWRVHIRPTVPTVAIVFGLFLMTVILLKKWMESIDAQVTMNFQSADYTLSLMADKKRKKVLMDVTSRDALVEADAVDSVPPSVPGNP